MQKTKESRYGKPRTTMAALAAALAIMALAAACGGGEPEELTFDLELKDRQLSASEIEARQHDTITLNIRSDETGTLHIHGYNIEKESPAGELTTMTFGAYATGKFNIAFHPGSGGHSHEGQSECEAELVAGEPTPQIFVNAGPADEPHMVEVAVETENIELSPDGNHWHLEVNGQAVGMYANPQVTFDSRLYESSGEYEIMVSLNNAQHCDYGIQAMTTVAMAGGDPMGMHDAGTPDGTMAMDHSSSMGDMKMDAGAEEPEEVIIASLVVQPR